MQPYLTHLRSLLPSWRARRAVDSHLASPSLDRHHLLISRRARFDRISAVTHSFFLTPLSSSRNRDPDTKGLLSSVPAKRRSKKGVKAKDARSIVKVRQETQASGEEVPALETPLPPDSVPSLFAALCELVDCSFIRLGLLILAISRRQGETKSQRKPILRTPPLPALSVQSLGVLQSHTPFSFIIIIGRPLHSSSERLL